MAAACILYVMSTGSKVLAAQVYGIHGREKLLALGIFDPIQDGQTSQSLEQARGRTRQRKDIMLRDGKDPSIEKRKEKLLRKVMSGAELSSRLPGTGTVIRSPKMDGRPPS